MRLFDYLHRYHPRFYRSNQLAFICLIVGLAGSCVNPRPDTTVAQKAPPPSFAGAVSSYYRGDFYGSISTLEQLSHDNTDAPRPRWELVHLYEEAGDYLDAIKALESLRSAAPDSSEVENALFTARVLAGQRTEAKSMLPLSKPSYRTIFLEAVLYMDLGQTAKAVTLFHEALAIHNHQPMAWFFLGEIAYADGNFANAQDDFQTVRKQNADLTIAIPPLARSILAQGKIKEAYPLLQRAQDILPNNEGIRNDIAKVERENPQLVASQSAATTNRQRYTLPPRVTTFPSASALAPHIRVALAEHLHSLTIKTGGKYEIRSLSRKDTLTYRGEEGEVLDLKRDGSDITLSRPGQPPFLSWSSPAVLRYMSPESTTVVFDLLSEKGSFFATSGDRAYRGEIILIPGTEGFTVVDRLPLEEYLYSVLPSEMYSFWPPEALKAQAVAARSYTLASMGAYAKKGFDVYGSVRSAAYLGVGNESKATTEAVNATQGQILEYDGKPLKAYYSANSGGYTETSKVVWGDPGGMAAVPDILLGERSHELSLTELTAWLQSDPASYSAVPPFFSSSAYRWTKWVSAAEITRRADRIKTIGTVLTLITRGRGISGRISKIELVGSEGNLTVKGDRIRSVLGDLRSTLFTYRPKLGAAGLPEYFIFTGGGWGHGVGMDQDGAAGMASAGYTYEQILSHYYPRAKLTTYPQGSEAALTPSSAKSRTQSVGE